MGAAVALLAEGDFETLRKRGWEIAFQRLAEMRDACRDYRQRGVARLLAEHYEPMATWSRVVPETWSVDDETQTAVDPRGDYDLFTSIRAKVAFLRSLPRKPIEQLAAAAGMDLSFATVLRHLIVTLALDRRELLVDQEARSRMSDCIRDGAVTPACREKVRDMIARQTRQALDHEADRHLILAALDAGLAYLGSNPPADWELFHDITDVGTTPINQRGGLAEG